MEEIYHKCKRHGSIPHGVTVIFHWHIPYGRTVDPVQLSL